MPNHKHLIYENVYKTILQFNTDELIPLGHTTRTPSTPFVRQGTFCACVCLARVNLSIFASPPAPIWSFVRFGRYDIIADV